LKKIFGAVVLLLALVSLILGQTKAPAGQNAVGEVTALERAYIESSRQYDIAWFERYLADSFSSTGDGVMSDKATVIANLKNRVRKTESVSYEELKVQAYGDAAVAVGLTNFKGTLNGKDASRKYRWTDTWVKRDGQWQCVAGHSSTVVTK
jgi:ketosteroid isomerase-like protein